MNICPKCNNPLTHRDPNNLYCGYCNLWNPQEWYKKEKEKKVNNGRG